MIIGLGAGHYTEARPSMRMVKRVGVAVQAWKNKRAKYILFCGGHTSGHIAEALEMKVMAQALGVPPRSILVEDASITTGQNAAFAKRIIRKKRFRSALLVTQRNHMDRALRHFKEIKRLRKIRKAYSDDYEPAPIKLRFDHPLPSLEPIQAVVVHGKSKPVDPQGDTNVVDSFQLSLARTIAWLHQNGLPETHFYIWHKAFGVGHVTRAEIIGLAAVAHGVPANRLIYSPARRFAENKRNLYETCKERGWKTVLAVLPRDRADDIELVEQAYAENGITAFAITAGK